jgi:hypothetical protein
MYSIIKNNELFISTKQFKKFLLSYGYKLHGESKKRFINILNLTIKIHKQRYSIQLNNNNNFQ